MSGLEMYEHLRHRVNKFVLLIDEDQAMPSPELSVKGSLAMLRLPFTPSEVDHALRSDVADEASADE